MLQSSSFIPILVMFLVLYLLLRNRKAIIARKVINNRRKGDLTLMLELAKRFIGKDCILYTYDGNHQFIGTIKEISNTAVLVENNGKEEAINLDFISRIREYPRNKKGKKKSVILD